MSFASVREIVESLEIQGVKFAIKGNEVKAYIPKPVRPAIKTLIDSLRPHKVEVREIVKAKHREGCEGCYSLGVYDGQERFIHPPRSGTEWLASWTPPEGTRTQ